jgi:hypothetical protein
VDHVLAYVSDPYVLFDALTARLALAGLDIRLVQGISRTGICLPGTA